MKLESKIVLAFFCLILFSACSQKHYVITGVEGTRILMDSTWDARVDPSVQQLINGYKQQLESQMNVVIGESEFAMQSGFPQSLLTNLTSDVIKQYGSEFINAPIDFAVSNVHGHRAALAQGPITIENLFEIYSFDNLVVILDLKGKAVKELFSFYAVNGGEGLSSGVQLVIRNREVVSLKIGGMSVDDNRIYRIATIDYLAEGNDGMAALSQAVHATATGVTLRDVMIDYVKKCTASGRKVYSKLDDRIVVN